MAEAGWEGTLRVIGLMSGTSSDGIDAALVTITGTGERTAFELDRFVSIPYPSDVRESLLDAARNYMGVADLALWHFRLGELFAAAALEVLAGDVADLVGSHGQTVAHLMAEPHRATLQIASPAIIAERTGLTVVSDFRARDVAAGGQGAPLVSFVDWLLLRHPQRSRVLVNIGGIANLTWVPSVEHGGIPIAFDTGPGNAMIDRAVYRLSGESVNYDQDGVMAARGAVDEAILAELMAHPYLARRPPKSTGREEFGDPLSDHVVDRMRESAKGPEDIVSTLSMFTARSIVRSLAWLPAVDEVIVAGGGAHNTFIMDRLKQSLGRIPLLASDEIGMPVDAKEAVSFALLANQTIRGLPGNVLGCTGARHEVVLGSITPGPNYSGLMRALFA
jgi:anhydro-N-acetylmuramic acid kinase